MTMRQAIINGTHRCSIEMGIADNFFKGAMQ